ncbi:unnamed protein product [Phyllotreta striolata]|uniref:EB domain-containing protein n=1 Tax=Phyllotreta striolata TaxID=444603 RepID=A0A9N9XNH6_PHYSR|nr:unnamed protein product [Phyllotreta striolata]
MRAFNKHLLFAILCVFITSVVCQQETDFSLRQSNLISYSKCRVDKDCLNISNNSFCFDNDAEKIGRCKCRDGFDMISRDKSHFDCLAAAGYGQPCEKNMQCQLILTEIAECHLGICQCKEGAHLYKDGRCYLGVLLDDFCQSDANCWLQGDKFGNCVFGRCTCKFDKEVPNEDKTDCITGKKLGELCNSDAECSITYNTQCRVKCQCAPDFVLSRDQTRCLRAATQFTDICEENDQCSAFLEGSICANETCTCEKGYHGYGNRCVKTVALKGSCASLDECILDERDSNALGCVDGTCECLKGVVNETLGCNRGELITFSYSVAVCSVMLHRFFNFL